MALPLSEELEKIKKEFSEWIVSEEAQSHIRKISKEIIEVQKLVSDLEKMDPNSDDFTELVLYGLLPYHNTRFAKRTSHFPVFMNIKQWFSGYNYTEEDYKIIAEIIFSAAIKVRDNPEKTQIWLNEFDQHTLSKGLQCGSITPIIFCLSNDLPLINGQVKKTFNYFSKFYNHGSISSRLRDYDEGKEKLRHFKINLNIEAIDDWTKMDLFCYWFNTLRNVKIKRKPEPRDYTKLIEDIDQEKTNLFINPYKPKSDTTTISEILKKCEENKWVLPYFQRFFSWSRTDVKDFLTSIFNDYYVGSFLFWEIYSESIPIGTLSIQGVGSQIDERKVESIIIDGQQRITSLYYAIKTPNFELRGSSKPSYFYLDLVKYFQTIANIEDESDRWDIVDVIDVRTKKLDRQESYEKMVFPIYELENRGDWIKEFQAYLLENTENQIKVYETIFFLKEKLDNVYHNYSIPYISLPDNVRIYEVSNIFQNINSKGKPLNTFDLLNARILRYNINLRNTWIETRKKYPKISEYYKHREIIPIYILQSIALDKTESKSCKKKDLLDIAVKAKITDDKLFKQTWFEACDSLEETINQIENLRDGFGVRSPREMPFMSMLPILTALNMEIKRNQPKKTESNMKTSQFYWSSVFTNRYSSSVESQMASDYRAMIKWFKDDTQLPQVISQARDDIPRIDFRTVSRKSSARYRGLLSLFALNGARDFESGMMLEMARTNDQHHIFPKAAFKNESQIDSVLNITWLSSETNRRIGKNNPADYYTEYINLKSNAESFNKILKSHYIEDKQISDLKNNDFRAFLQHRNEKVLEIISQKIGLLMEEGSTIILTPDEPYSNIIKLKKTLSSCSEYIYWIDKYFSSPAFEILLESIDPSIKEINILTSIYKTTEKIRTKFKRFKDEMKNKGINTEMRVMIDSKMIKRIHDRWIIASNVSYNVPSIDSIMRGQYSEIIKTESKVPYQTWWDNSNDIITDWNKIKDKLKNE